MNFFNRLKENFFKLNMAQQISVGVLALCVPALIAISVNAVTTSAEYMEQQSSAVLSSSEEISSSEVISSSSEEETSSQENSSSAELITITLRPSSVEEDLEVEIVDEKVSLLPVTPSNLPLKAKPTDTKANGM